MVTFAAQAADGASVWWVWVLGGIAVWFAVAVLLGVAVGRGIRRADVAEGHTAVLAALSTADLPADLRPAPAPARRRAIPIPTFGLALFAVAVALETVGFIVRLSGSEGSLRALSMDAPFSLPRMYVAALFATAALAAVAGAGVLPGRRSWWLAVGVVSGGIAAVKAGSTVHAEALRSLSDAVGSRVALLVSIAAAAVVVGALWLLSRNERRDRRRVLGVLGGYALASVGLSAVSGAVAGAAGGFSTWAVAATYLEESGEALAGVAFLIAVLAGVAPRVVLPPTWGLRRSADAHTLELPEQLPTRTATDGRSLH